MNTILYTGSGCTEAVIDDDCGPTRFFEVADMLANDLHINFFNKLNDVDSLLWDFHFKGHTMGLHYNVYTGISIFEQCVDDTQLKQPPAVMEVAVYLESKLMVNAAKAYVS